LGRAEVILLDTHVLLWTALEPDRLSRTASSAIQKARREGSVCISDVSLWEIALLARRRKISISGSIDAFLFELSLPLVVKPITPAIAAMSVAFPDEYPSDPADRLIGATSNVEGLPLVTADRQLRLSLLIRTIW
jgi:PIN domain nuclease of toxin-antitoxin system